MNAPGAPAILGDEVSVVERVRVRGVVQGVGFRPAVWRIANALGVRGSVSNDAAGVLIEAVATSATLDELAVRLRSEAPPLARIETIERQRIAAPEPSITSAPDFRIAASGSGPTRTEVAADAVTCADCIAEILDPFARRYRYALTNCTHCGPRLSFITGMPYDRPRTTMSDYPLCAACRREYEAPADRRFHAQGIACHACGPKVVLRRLDGRAFTLDAHTFLDDCDAAGSLLAKGHVVAIKGLGGYQLACDATNVRAVERLRLLKRREGKPFAMMLASVDAIRAWCHVDDDEARALQSPGGPIVLLERGAAPAQPPIADAVAPGVACWGFMLPPTGVHHLVLRRMKRPIVLTSGNLSEEPQAITLEQLSLRFAGGLDYVLDHGRPIARRVDDSVLRAIDGYARVLRRARGYAPAAIRLPPGFDAAPPVLAYGGELKNTLCLLRNGRAVLSQHLGDLADAATQADWQRTLRELPEFLGFRSGLRACDGHPDYLSTRQAQQDARQDGAEAIEVLHHHAHVAACLADNGWPLDAGPVIGIALDGLGLGADGELWGGEFAIADYVRFERRGTFKPVALLGGEQAMREPWRNTYAHLMAELGWPALAMNYGELEITRFLAGKPRESLDAMLARGTQAPRASSCGRLFDAVAAATGVCRDRVTYEGQAAVELEALVDRDVLENEDHRLGYPFTIPRLKASRLRYVEPLAMWTALLGDLVLETPVPTIAARFHKGLALAIATMADQIASATAAEPSPGPGRSIRHVALSGGVFQNRVLAGRVAHDLRTMGYIVMMHREVPCNDGGLALGQATIAAARALSRDIRED
jgi:hydrogenase maturation protein HypF